MPAPPLETPQLPTDEEQSFAPWDCCIYCGALDGLTDEHIIPFGLGGRRILPRASCRECAAKTGALERTCLRTMLGPLRMFLNLPTRRRKDRPKRLPLKVKLTPDADWTFIDVDRADYPFLVLMPLLDGLPDEVSRNSPEGSRQAAVRNLWIRGASFRGGVTEHLEQLAETLNVAAIEPQGHVLVPEFTRMLAKIAHAYACAFLTPNSFEPWLTPMIVDADTSEALRFVGGPPKAEPATNALHDLGPVYCTFDPTLIVVRIRLFACLGTPTYVVAVGRKLARADASGESREG